MMVERTVVCIKTKVQYGMVLRCTRPNHHKGNHRWAEDKNFYPFGRLNPDDPIDQAIVSAFNKGAARGGEGSDRE